MCNNDLIARVQVGLEREGVGVLHKQEKTFPKNVGVLRCIMVL